MPNLIYGWNLYDPIYVSITGSDSTGDGTLSNPFATYQVAYDKARYGFIYGFWNGNYTVFNKDTYVLENVDGSIVLVIYATNGWWYERTIQHRAGLPPNYETNSRRIFNNSGVLMFYTDNTASSWYATTDWDALEQLPSDFNIIQSAFREYLPGTFVIEVNDPDNDQSVTITLYENMLLTEDEYAFPKIALRGNGIPQLTIIANGWPEIYDYEVLFKFRPASSGFNVYLIGDNSNGVNNIVSNGANNDAYHYEIPNVPVGGDIILINMTCNNITSTGGNAPIGPVNTNGGNGGNITINNCETGNILSQAGNGYSEYSPPGNGGAIVIANSTCGDIDSIGGMAWLFGESSGGPITITNSTIGNIESSSYPNTVTLIGNTNIPNNIKGVIITSSLNKGRGVNGSNILGVV